ncbi:MAG: hypothetical protein ACUVTM_01570 [Candidatus Bathyarchaeia archaeon]
MKLIRGSKIPVEVTVRTDGLELVEGSNTLNGVAEVDSGLVLEFGVTSRAAGLRSLGPIVIAAKDKMGLLVKDMPLPNVTYMIFLAEPHRVPASLTRYIPTGLSGPGLSKDPYTGLEDDYRISLPSVFTPNARAIDWKRLAKTDGDEPYVKEFDRRRSANMIYGLGSGLDIHIPKIGFVYELVLTLILQLILEQLKEGSQTWLFQQAPDGGFNFARVLYSGGELKVEGAEALPSSGRIIYLSRMIVDGELDDVARLTSTMKGEATTLLLNISGEVGGLIPSGIAERLMLNEERRLKDLAVKSNVRFSLVELDSLPEVLRRAISRGDHVVQ